MKGQCKEVNKAGGDDLHDPSQSYDPAYIFTHSQNGLCLLRGKHYAKFLV